MCVKTYIIYIMNFNANAICVLDYILINTQFLSFFNFEMSNYKLHENFSFSGHPEFFIYKVGPIKEKLTYILHIYSVYTYIVCVCVCVCYVFCLFLIESSCNATGRECRRCSLRRA